MRKRQGKKEMMRGENEKERTERERKERRKEGGRERGEAGKERERKKELMRIWIHGNSNCITGKFENGTTSMENRWQFLKKIKNRITI